MIDVESIREDIQILAGRWELSVIASLQRGARGHAELARVIGTDGKQLTRVLRRLQRRGLITRQVEIEAPPVRVRYSLTRQGERLFLAAAAFANWNQADGCSEPPLEAIDGVRIPWEQVSSKLSVRRK